MSKKDFPKEILVRREWDGEDNWLIAHDGPADLLRSLDSKPETVVVYIRANRFVASKELKLEQLGK